MDGPDPIAAGAAARVQKAIAKNDHKGAVAQAERALRQGLRHPLLLRTVAAARLKSGRTADAGDLLNRALALDPADPDTLCAIGVVLLSEDRAGDAIEAFAHALKLNPMHAVSWTGIARAFEAAEDDEKARTAYERAANLGEPDALAGLAQLHFEAGRTDMAQQHAAEALAATPRNALANLVNARIALRRDADEARRLSESVIVRGGDLTLFERLTAFKTLGDAFDRLDRIEDAVNAYGRMNAAIAQAFDGRFGRDGPVENHLHFIARLERAYSSTPDDWRAPAAPIGVSPVRGHVFVLGYPRSGNTLAGAILGALDDVRVLEERRTLADTDLAHLKDEHGLLQLARIAPKAAEELRDLYWRRVRRDVPDVDGKIFVDMSPLNSLKLPIIRKLFPNARIVLCTRDARDVVLSCWRQNFTVNAATYQMTDLVGTARHFDAVMSLVRGAPLTQEALTHLHYDDFMRDFEAGARHLVTGVGLGWSDRCLNFADAARSRPLRTASAHQVRSGLFDGRGQWRRYEAHLAPAIPIIQHWIDDLRPDGREGAVLV